MSATTTIDFNSRLEHLEQRGAENLIASKSAVRTMIVKSLGEDHGCFDAVIDRIVMFYVQQPHLSADIDTALRDVRRARLAGRIRTTTGVYFWHCIQRILSEHGEAWHPAVS